MTAPDPNQPPPPSGLQRSVPAAAAEGGETPLPMVEVSGLEREVTQVPFGDPEQLIAFMQEAKRRTCRIEIDGAALGTGFLVGPQTVLTNWHVVEGVGAAQFAKVSCRFDYIQRIDGARYGGLPLALDGNGLLFHRPYAPAEITADPENPPPDATELDYALLRLAERAGDKRGWFALPGKGVAVAEGANIWIVQHPDGKPLKFAADMKSLLKCPPPPGRPRLRYLTNTEKGSSGSPCFSMTSTGTFELVALHHFGDPVWPPGIPARFNQGIPIALIRIDIEASGFGSELGGPLGSAAVNVEDAFREIVQSGAARSAIVDSAHVLKNVTAGILTLTAYKRIHDSIHSILLLSSQVLLAAAEQLASADDDVSLVAGGNLGSLLEMVRKAVDAAGVAKDRLGADAQFEATWIEQLSAQGDALSASIEARSAFEARFAVLKVIALAESQAGRLNGLIVGKATILPLDGLAALLRSLPDAPARTGTSLSASARDIETVRDILQQRAALHNKLQDILVDVSVLSQSLKTRGPDLLADFARYWPKLRAKLNDVLATPVDAGFPLLTVELKAKIDAIEDKLVVEASMPPGRGLDQQSAAIRDLDRKFQDFGRVVARHFYRVDQSLLADLDRLSDMCQPLYPLIE
jgi:trypsin-like peptidase